MHRVSLAVLALAVSALALTACAQDPFERPNTWSPARAPSGSSNNANLRTMVADPQDLVAGSGAPNSSAAIAAPAVRRLLEGRRPPLPTTSTNNIQGYSGSQGGAPAASSAP